MSTTAASATASAAAKTAAADAASVTATTLVSTSVSGSSSVAHAVPAILSSASNIGSKPPPALPLSASIVDPTRGLLIVSGGYLDVRALANDSNATYAFPPNYTVLCQSTIFVLHIPTNTWYKNQNSLVLPVGLCGHTVSLLGSTLWFLGGSTSVYLPNPNTSPSMNTNPPPFNSLAISLDLDTGAWKQTTPSSTIQRYNHVAEVDAVNNVIYVFGGQTAWLQPVISDYLLLKLQITDDSLITTNIPVTGVQPRTQSSSISITSNFNHSIMLVYGGYTSSSTANSLSLSPLSSSQNVFAYDMTLRTIASTYIVYFQPYNSSFSGYDTDPTLQVASTASSSTTSTTTTTTSSFVDANTTTATTSVPASSSTTETYPAAPSTYFSSLSDSTVMGPCLSDAQDCLNFALVKFNTSSVFRNKVYFYGGGQENTSSSNSFWELDTSVDGMWYWTQINAPSLPQWSDVHGGAITLKDNSTSSGVADTLEFVLPVSVSIFVMPQLNLDGSKYDDGVNLTGGLVHYHLNNQSFEFDVASEPNINDYYTASQGSSPLSASPISTSVIVGSVIGVAVVIVVTMTIVVYRRKRFFSRMHSPYFGTPEPGVFPGPPRTPPVTTPTSLMPPPRSSTFKLNTSRVSATPAISSSTTVARDMGASGAATLESGPPELIAMSEFAHPPGAIMARPNRLVASWRVLTGAQPIAPVTQSGASGGIRRLGSVGGALGTISSETLNVVPTSEQVQRPPVAAPFFSAPPRTVTSDMDADNLSLGELPSYEHATTVVSGTLSTHLENTGTAGTIITSAGEAANSTAAGSASRQPTAAADSVSAATVALEALVAGVTGAEPRVIATHPHSPVGKDEIELRVGDVLTVLDDLSAHAAFVRGFNNHSGRVGLFPRHCVAPLTEQDEGGARALGWFRERAARFQNALNTPAGAGVLGLADKRSNNSLGATTNAEVVVDAEVAAGIVERRVQLGGIAGPLVPGPNSVPGATAVVSASRDGDVAVASNRTQLPLAEPVLPETISDDRDVATPSVPEPRVTERQTMQAQVSQAQPVEGSPAPAEAMRRGFAPPVRVQSERVGLAGAAQSSASVSV
ncbi:hypothetical protein HDU83_007305 [Entophlyctis luteolus]|nr:hypothetical protein HDU83_007305 [Entophlyctis luteolus]